MEFKIVETYRNHNFIDFLKQFVVNTFLFLIAIIVIPAVLIINLFQKKNRNLNEENIAQEGKWIDFIKTDKITLYRKFINQNDLPGDLDLPNEYNELDTFEVKSEPKFAEFENVIFKDCELETEKGIYLISINKIGNEMSLLNIDKKSNEIKIVTKLKSLWWDFSINENKIVLKGIEKKKEYIIEILEI